MITLLEIAKKFELEFEGDGNCLITNIAPLKTAQKGSISFLDNPKYKKYLSDTQASVVILSTKYLSFCPTNALLTENPYYIYAKTAELFKSKIVYKEGLHPSVILGQNCQIAPTASIEANVVLGDGVVIDEKAIVGAGCVIGSNSKIGSYSKLAPNVTLAQGVTIGERSLIHSGVVIGADGFGFARTRTGWYKVPQLGNVRIGNDVEIGANTTIDKGALEDTIIEDGVKLDNQIQVGHNVKIGANTIIAGCTAIAGSTIIGKDCMIGGCVDINGHIEIADKVIITAATCVSKSILQAGIYSSGVRARPHEEWLKNSVQFEHLNDLAKRLKKLESLMEVDKA